MTDVLYLYVITLRDGKPQKKKKKKIFYTCKVGTRRHTFVLNLHINHPRLILDTRNSHKMHWTPVLNRRVSLAENVYSPDDPICKKRNQPAMEKLFGRLQFRYWHISLYSCTSRWSNGYITMPYHDANNGRFVFSLSIVLLLYVFLPCDVIQTLALFL